jgi:hypothetical protein
VSLVVSGIRLTRPEQQQLVIQLSAQVPQIMASGSGGGSAGTSPASSQDELQMAQWGQYVRQTGSSSCYSAPDPNWFTLLGSTVESQRTTPNTPEAYCTNSLHSSESASPSRRNKSPAAAPMKAKPRRKRPSRRVPTALLEASSSEFRGLVEQLTGVKPDAVLATAGESAARNGYTPPASSTNHLPRPQPIRAPTRTNTQDTENFSLQAQYNAAQARSRSPSGYNNSHYNNSSTMAVPLEDDFRTYHSSWNYSSGHEDTEAWMRFFAKNWRF